MKKVLLIIFIGITVLTICAGEDEEYPEIMGIEFKARGTQPLTQAILNKFIEQLGILLRPENTKNRNAFILALNTIFFSFPPLDGLKAELGQSLSKIDRGFQNEFENALQIWQTIGTYLDLHKEELANISTAKELHQKVANIIALLFGPKSIQKYIIPPESL